MYNYKDLILLQTDSVSAIMHGNKKAQHKADSKPCCAVLFEKVDVLKHQKLIKVMQLIHNV